jgi:hypothetical protein
MWDVTSDRWEKAKWEDNAMLFSYDTKMISNPFGYALINEVAFQDPRAQDETFEMTADKYGTDYTSIMQGSSDPNSPGALMVTTIKVPSDVPAPPTVRINDNVKSVFPVLSIFQFDELGTSFSGAYTIPNSDQVYAVKGIGVLPSAIVPEHGPVKTDYGSTLDQYNGVNEKSKLFHSTVKPVPHVFKSGNASNPLPVIGLINNDPTAPDPGSSTGYSDFISAVANEDFHNIICYWMDGDIHTTFVSASPTVLDPTIQAIATDSEDNAAFYKTLQVPYVVSSLARSTLDEGKQCNAVRADGQLKNLPSNSLIYKRHSDALYRNRFLAHFSGVQDYLDDQAGKTGNDYTTDMLAGANAMKTQITNLSQDVNGPDPDTAKKNLDAALADIDSLHDWAVQNKLFYAFDLYYWCSNFYLMGNSMPKAPTGLCQRRYPVR